MFRLVEKPDFVESMDNGYVKDSDKLMTYAKFS